MTMRIVHFSAGRINPYAAKVGSVNVIYWLAREQAKLENEVDIVIMPAKRDYPNVDTDEFRILEYPPATFGGFRLPPSLVYDIKQGRLRIDIAHLHGIYVPQMIAVAKLLRKLNIPYVVSTHGSLSPLILKRGSVLAKKLFKTLFIHSYLNEASFIHVHSRGELKDAKWFGLRKPIVIAEHGFDWEIFPKDSLDSEWLARRFPEHKRNFKLIFLGRLDPYTKGIDLLLYAFAEALKQQRDITLFLVGPPKRRYKNVIPTLIRRLGIEKNVVLVGPLYDPIEKYSAIASSDVFVLTSRYEGFPLTIYEAMACGKPLIVTPGTNAAEWVEKHNLGWVSNATPDSIADAILEAYTSRHKLTAMGGRAKDVVRAFTWRRTAQILEKAYLEVTGIEK